MRCKCCNEMLTEVECLRKDPETKQHLDTCTYCLRMSKTYVADSVEDEIDFLETGLDIPKKV